MSQASFGRYVAQDTDQDEVIENGTNGDFKTTIVLEPIGVVGAITPWCARRACACGRERPREYIE